MLNERSFKILSIPRWKGARPEPKHIVGRQRFQGEHVSWMPNWFRKFVEAPVIKPEVQLSSILYPKVNR